MESILKIIIMKYLYTILLVLLTYSISYSQDTLYVSPEASYPNFPNISSALDSANSGDIILVAQGTYGQILSINKSITISPLTQGTNYTISANTIFTTPSDNIEVYIVGAVLNNISTSIGGSFDVFVNYISCEILGNVSMANNSTLFSSYYSKFYNTITLRNVIEIIGCEFTSNSQMKTLTIDNNSSNTEINNYTSKLFANKFLNYRINVNNYSTTLYMPSKLEFSNNFLSINSEISSFTSIFTFSNNDICYPISITNNTFSILPSSTNSYGLVIKNSYNSSQLTLSFNNNLINTTSNEELFYIYSSSFDLMMLNNHIFSEFEDVNSIFNGLIPYEGFVSDNIMNNDSCISCYDEENGISLYDESINNGLDSFEFRDIDNTINDIGTYGGPHSWINYHNGSGPKVIDINIPSIIAPGMNISINGKGVNIND